MDNDNRFRNVRSERHSLSLALLAGDYVLSCYTLGPDGEPDTDSGEVFHRTVSADTALRQFQDYAELFECPAARFDREVEWVMHARASLTSCLHREVPNEARILRRAIDTLSMAVLKRRNQRREALRDSVIKSAQQLIESRTENLDEKIRTEARIRTAKGQP